MIQLYPRLSPAQREMAMELVRAKCLYPQQYGQQPPQQAQPNAPTVAAPPQQLF
jgi:hypothetical protein